MSAIQRRKWSRRRFCEIVSLALVAGQGGIRMGNAAQRDTRPNIIFILTDDQRADTLGCMGNRIVKTPHIDGLAAEGTLFENASVTSALCTPSRASFFSGQYERRHGVNFNSGTAMAASAWRKTYPMRLKDAGYFLGYVGKNHVPIGDSGYATGLMDESFDYWYAGHTHLLFYPKERPPFTIKIPGIDEHMFDNAKADTQVEILQEGVSNFLEPNEDFYAGAVRFLKRRPKDRPFCLSICFNLPHDAGSGNMEDRASDPELYKSGYRDQRQAILDDLPATYVAADEIREPKLPPDVLCTEMRQDSYDYVNTREDMAERITRRYQSITGIDRLVGGLREQLNRLGLSDNTVIIFTSDHGIMRGEFGLGGKALCYEACLQIPMIVYDPTAPAGARGQRRAELVQSIDVAPTMLDYAGVDVSNWMQGRSMRSLIQGEQAGWREHAFSENLWSTYFGNPRIESVRGQRWKYIRYFKNDRSIYDEGLDTRARYKVSNLQARKYREWLSASVEGEVPVYEELFDLEADPDEVNNLVGDPARQATLEEYRSICGRLVSEALGEGKPPTVPLSEERLEFYLQTLEHD